MRNFELGLVFALPADGFEKAANEVVCWRRHARPYGDAVPWVSFYLLPLGVLYDRCRSVLTDARFFDTEQMQKLHLFI